MHGINKMTVQKVDGVKFIFTIIIKAVTRCSLVYLSVFVFKSLLKSKAQKKTESK